jgi:phosphotransacetylase
MSREATSFADLEVKTRSRPPLPAAVASPLGVPLIEAILRASSEGLVSPILVGPRAEVRSALHRMAPERLGRIEIVDEGEEGAAKTAVSLVREGRARILIQGRVPFAELLPAMRDPDHGISTGRVLSGIHVFEDPRQGSKGLLALSDPMVNPQPDAPCLRQIIENGVAVLKRLGFDEPAVALLSGTNQVDENLPWTQLAREMRKEMETGIVEGCLVDGPFTLDVALDRACAEERRIFSAVAGRARLLVPLRRDAARILLDTLQWLLGVKGASIVSGATAPVVPLSRAHTLEDRLRAILLARAVA